MNFQNDDVDIDIRNVRTKRLSYPLAGFEQLSDANWFDATGSRWGNAEFSMEVDKNLDWDALPNREFGWRLHAWEPLDKLLELAAEGDVPSLLLAVELAQKWTDKFGAQSPSSTGDSFAWYDMSFPYRAHRLAFLLDVCARREVIADDRVAFLFHVLEHHFAIMQNDDYFHAHNNHGFFQTVPAMAAARRWPEVHSKLAQVCESRLVGLLEELIDSDGLLREHSPGYQAEVVVLLQRATKYGLITEEQRHRLQKMEHALLQFVMPDRYLARFGDTKLVLPPKTSGGLSLGLPDGDKLFAEAGFWIARCGRSALAVHAGFHSNVHKHADHGTFVWFEDGAPFLIEAGFFPYEGSTDLESVERREGFYYSNPKRMYVESTRAHNCLEIGGKSYSRRPSRYFGSGIHSARFESGFGIVSMRFDHGDAIHQDRLLAWAPGKFLLIVDAVEAPVLPITRQWFHLAPNIDVHADERGWQGARLSAFDLTGTASYEGPIRGQVEPELQGWHDTGAGRLEEHNAIALVKRESNRAFFATLFVLDGQVPVLLSSDNPAWPARHTQLAWRLGKEIFNVDISRTLSGLDAVFEKEVLVHSLKSVSEFRRWRQNAELLPFESLDVRSRPNAKISERNAMRLLERGWVSGSHTTKLEQPINWDGSGRSISFHLHSWDLIAPLLMGYSETGERKFLDRAFLVAQDWIARFGVPESAQDALSRNEGMSWYDMAVGLRVHRLAYLLDAVARIPDFDDEAVAALLKLFILHLEVLGDEKFFAAKTNHGFYQALGMLAAAFRYKDSPDVEPIYRQAVERTKAMIEQQFFEEGSHREHSPGYHYAVLSTLRNVWSSGIIEDQSVKDKIDQIGRVFSTLMLPNENFAPIGDTDPGPVWDEDNEERQEPSDPNIASGIHLLKDAGIFIVRKAAYPDRHPNMDSYLLQHAGFHSRTHKHADDGTFIWYDRGHELIVDSGRYFFSEMTKPDSEEFKNGFWYADPKRMYVETTRAHNCVVIDDRDYARRGVKPFGSALTAYGSNGSLYWSECSFKHFKTIRHERRLFFRPDHFLIVLDWVRGGADAVHSLDQWFHLAPDFDLTVADDIAQATHSISGLSLSIQSLLGDVGLGSAVRGEEDGVLQGWVSTAASKIVPNWAISMRGEGNTVTFATLLSLESGAVSNPGRTRVNASARKGRLIWSDARGNNAMAYEKLEDGSLVAEFSQS